MRMEREGVEWKEKEEMREERSPAERKNSREVGRS